MISYDMKNIKCVGENLKYFMGEMSPTELERISGVPAMTIGRILKEDGSPRCSTLERIAKALKIPLPALVCSDETLRHIIIGLSTMPQDDLKGVRKLLKL